MTTTKRVSNHKLLALLLGLLLTALLLCALAPKAHAEIASGTIETCSWVIDDEGNLTVSPTNGVFGTISSNDGGSPWKNYKNDIKTIMFDPGVQITGTGGEYLFRELSSVTTIDLSNVSTEGLRNMAYMFGLCSQLTTIKGIESINTASVTDMIAVFYKCHNLVLEDLTAWNTSNVGSMYNMFLETNSIQHLNLSGWDTSNVVHMGSMFRGDQNGASKLESLNLSGWKNTKTQSMNAMFEYQTALTELNLTGFETPSATTMDRMFDNCRSLPSVDVSNWNTSNVTDMSAMFSSCNALNSLDVSNWDTGNVKEMDYMFPHCFALTSLDVSGWNTENVTTMSSMFFECRSLTALDVSNWNTGKVTTTYRMFAGCSSLTALDVSKWDTGSNTTLNAMFSSCTSLTSLDMDNWNTSSVKTMTSMFYNCKNLQSAGVSNWSLTNVTALTDLFHGCESLTSVDVSKWDISNVRNMNYMFRNCKSLDNLDVSKWNTSSLVALQYAFENCNSLTSLDVSGWDTSNATNLIGVFSGCRSLKVLDLSSWDTSKTTSMSSMLSGCTGLTAVALGEKTLAYSPDITGAPLNWVKYAELSGRRVYDGEKIYSLWRAQDYPGWYKRQGSIAPNETDLYSEFTSEEEEQTEYWVKDGNVWSYTFNLYDDTKTYYIWEDPIDGFSAKDGKGTASDPIVLEPDPDTNQIPAVASILNTRPQETGSITVNKVVSGSGGGSFRFVVTLTGDEITGTQKFGDVTFNKGVGYFFLSHGESMTLSDIPVGTSFTISEEPSGGYTCSWSETPSGTIVLADQAFSFTCTNNPPPPPPPPPGYVDLHITKIVTGHYSHANPFTFTASFSGLNAYLEYQYSVAGVSKSFTASDTGEAYVTFDMADGEQTDFYDLPVGSTYQISEDGGDWTASYLITDSAGGSSIVSTGGSAGIGKPLNTALETANSGEDITVAYTNVLEKTEDISIKKVLDVPAGEEASDDSFTFTVNFENLTPGAYYNSDIGTIRADADGFAARSFSLKAGEQFFFYGLPVGASYRFTEAANPYIAAFVVEDANGGKSIVQPDGANAKSRLDLATGAETVDEDESIVVTFTNTPVPLRDIDVQKIWDDANDQDGIRPKSIDVQLTANGAAYGSPVTLTRSMGWAFTWTDLDVYDDAGNEIAYAVEELSIKGYTSARTGDMTEGFTITNTHKPETTQVPVRKVWNDADNQDGKRPESITVNLLADGEKISSAVLSEYNSWSAVFEDLPKFKQGVEIVYTVTEDSVSAYALEIAGAAADGYGLTRSYEPETTSVSGHKIWKDDDDRDRVRPESVTVRLRANGKEVAQAVVSEKTDWAYSFTDLPVYEKGVEIVYTVSEDAVSGYTAKILDNYDIENSYTPGKTGVSVTKVWDDQNDKDHMRPLEIKVQLLADGEKYGEPVVLNADNNWIYSWTGLNEKNEGKVIAYTVEEIAVEGYETELVGNAETGFVLINHHTVEEPPKTGVSVQKIWDDLNDHDGLRPKEIQVQLLADGEKLGDPVVLNAANKWAFTWSDLDESRDGKPITYTIEEIAVEGYETEVIGDAWKGFILINHHTVVEPPKTDVHVTKIWNDGNDRDKLRPKEIYVQLMANGRKCGDLVVLNAGNNWSYSWTGLEKTTENGKPIVYTVWETAIKGYEGEVRGSAETGFILINHHGGSPKTGDAQDFLRLGVIISFALLGGGLTVVERRRKLRRSK